MLYIDGFDLLCFVFRMHIEPLVLLFSLHIERIACFCFYVELKRAMSCVVTSECSECSSRLPVTTPKSPSMSCRNDDSPATDEMKRLEEELANKDLEIEALRVGFLYLTKALIII